MANEINMPQLSDTMDKGTILRWYKKEGDAVIRGDALAEVATDKADLEIESFHEGTLLKIYAAEGTSVGVGEVIAMIGAQGESVEQGTTSAKNLPAQEAAEPTSLTNTVPEPGMPIQNRNFQSSQPSTSTPIGGSATNGSGYPAGTAVDDKGPSSARVKISPLARNLADSNNINVSSISGTGEGGRIVRKDVEKAIGTSSQASIQVEQESPQAAPRKQLNVEGDSAPKGSLAPVGSGQVRIEPLSKMRETIATRMVESVNTAPHFFATTKIYVDELVRVREVLKQKAEYEGITFTHLITKAVGLSLRAFPRINSRYESNSIHEPQDVNIGIITALPDGLLIPVIKYADAQTLANIVQDSKAMTQRARAGKPKADDLSGGTFSISNIGRNEVEHFTAIINPGQGAILAVSSIQEEPIVKDGAVVPGKTLRVTLSVDHRIIDGVIAGEFLTHLKGLLEEPVLLFA